MRGLLAAVAASSLFAVGGSQASGHPFFVMAVLGTVASGTDVAGAYGPAGADLTGRSFAVDYEFIGSAKALTLQPDGFTLEGGSDNGTISLGSAIFSIDTTGTTFDGGQLSEIDLTPDGPDFGLGAGYYDFKAGAIQSGGAAAVFVDLPGVKLTYPYSFSEFAAACPFGCDPAANRFTLANGDSGTLSPETLIFTILTVPEPATWALIILGFGAAGGALRRRRTMTAS